MTSLSEHSGKEMNLMNDDMMKWDKGLTFYVIICPYMSSVWSASPWKALELYHLLRNGQSSVNLVRFCGFSAANGHSMECVKYIEYETLRFFLIYDCLMISRCLCHSCWLFQPKKRCFNRAEQVLYSAALKACQLGTHWQQAMLLFQDPASSPTLGVRDTWGYTIILNIIVIPRLGYNGI